RRIAGVLFAARLSMMTNSRYPSGRAARIDLIDTAEHGLITELEQPADPADPAAQAYRARIRARFADLYAERTATEAKLTTLQAETPQDNDLSLLDLLPVAAGLFADAPDRIGEALLAAFDIQALYRSDMHQVTIWATLTSDTPRTRPGPGKTRVIFLRVPAT
ncbi:MAG: hypothetical protein ACRDND_30525, partial [Streptosporangiaceae bacterium]